MSTISIQPTSGALETVQATFHARLRSLTPLLMHAPTAMKANTGEVKRSGQKNIPTPEEEAAQGAYQFDDGTLYLPAVALQRTMIEAGKAFQNPTNKRATLMRAIAATLVPPPVEGFPLLNPATGEAITDYEIDVRRAVVQRAAVMRARPRIDEWESDVSMEFDIEALGGGGDPEQLLRNSGEVLMMVLAHAGKRVGIGDYRPERSGPFGRFEILSFTVTDEDR